MTDTNTRPFEDRLPHARVITPQTTFVKYEFKIWDGIAEIKQYGRTIVTLTDATAGYVAGQIRVEGTDVAGERTVWLVDTLGCGCGIAAHTEPTTDIPT